jgi:osmotically-inducible protein OsmY
MDAPVEASETRGPGDEAIADAVRRELSEDAATTDLDVDVDVDDGIVRLSGRVPELVDAENAESVAGRVSGVDQVIDDLEVPGLDRKLSRGPR